MSGNAQFLGSNQAFLIAFLKDPSQRPPIAQVAGEIMGAIANTIPGTVAFLQPNPRWKSALVRPRMRRVIRLCAFRYRCQ